MAHDAELESGALAEVVSSIGEMDDAAKTKDARKVIKAEKKAAKRARKAAKREAKKTAKTTRKAVAEGTDAPRVTVEAKTKEPKVTVSKARNAINVGKVVAPVLLPVLKPYAVRAASAGRSAYENYRARKLGVSVDDLGEFKGHGAALHARIAGVMQSLQELRESGDAEKRRFAEDTRPSVEQLSSAVRAAERMPTTRRKQAHRAVSDELDSLETRLLKQLGV